MKFDLRRSLVGLLILVRRRIWQFRTRRFPHSPVSVNYIFYPRFKLYPEGQIAETAYISNFERMHIRHALRYVKQGMFAVDVGANIGLWTVCLAKRVGASGRVHAFEPSKDTVDLLNRNIRVNGLQSIVSVHQEALGIQEGTRLLNHPAWGGDADRFLTHVSLSGEKRGEEVQVTTIDHWMENHKLTCGIDFIKIDCEGSELHVLQGAKNTLSRTSACLAVCECNPDACARQGYNISNIYDCLEGFGFVVGYLHQQTKIWIAKRPPLDFNGNIVAVKG